jgi:rubredoxin
MKQLATLKIAKEKHTRGYSAIREEKEICPDCEKYMHKQNSIKRISEGDKKNTYAYIPTSWLCRICGKQILNKEGFEAIREDKIIIKNVPSDTENCPKCNIPMFNQSSRKKIGDKYNWLSTSLICRKCGYMKLKKKGFESVKIN